MNEKTLRALIEAMYEAEHQQKGSISLFQG